MIKMTNTKRTKLTSEEFKNMINRTSFGKTENAIVESEKRVRVTITQTETSMGYCVNLRKTFGWEIESVAVFRNGETQVIYQRI